MRTKSTSPFTLNVAKTRHERLDGRDYLVAPSTLLRHNVLRGSRGALYYPPGEIAKNADQWNGTVVTLGHPTDNGKAVSARSPEIIEKFGLGTIFNAGYDQGKESLTGELWLDVERVKKVRPDILNRLNSGQAINLSTGLFTENDKAPKGATFRGRPYDFIARSYRADHLAILPDVRGACSIEDGCGVLVNQADTSFIDVYYDRKREALLKPHTEIVDTLDLNELNEGDEWHRVYDGVEGVKYHVVRNKSSKLTNTLDTLTEIRQQNKQKWLDGAETGFNLSGKTVSRRTFAEHLGGVSPDPTANASLLRKLSLPSPSEEKCREQGKRCRPAISPDVQNLLNKLNDRNQGVGRGGPPISNQEEEPTMAQDVKLTTNERTDLIEAMVSNCSSFGEDDREWLESLDDSRLRSLAENCAEVKVLNARLEELLKADDDEPEDDDEDDDEPEEEVTKNKKTATKNKGRGKMPPFIKEKIEEDEEDMEDNCAGKKPTKNERVKMVRDDDDKGDKGMTENEWLEKAPPGIAALVREALQSKQQEKEALVDRIAANKRCRFTREFLLNKETDELSVLADAISPETVTRQRPTLFAGAAAPSQSVQNEEEMEELALPVMNFNS